MKYRKKKAHRNLKLVASLFNSHQAVISNIQRIHHINGGITKICCVAGRSVPNLSILNAYAQYMAYNSSGDDTRWGISDTINTIQTNLVEIWPPAIMAKLQVWGGGVL